MTAKHETSVSMLCAEIKHSRPVHSKVTFKFKAFLILSPLKNTRHLSEVLALVMECKRGFQLCRLNLRLQ